MRIGDGGHGGRPAPAPARGKARLVSEVIAPNFADDHRGVRTVERAASKRQQREASDAVVGEVGRNNF